MKHYSDVVIWQVPDEHWNPDLTTFPDTIHITSNFDDKFADWCGIAEKFRFNPERTQLLADVQIPSGIAIAADYEYCVIGGVLAQSGAVHINRLALTTTPADKTLKPLGHYATNS